jgi:hypothetical protein
MHWVYVLECEENRIYVGETINLFKRLNEHIRGEGGENTRQYRPKCLRGLYKVSVNSNFLDYMTDIIGYAEEDSENQSIVDVLREKFENMGYSENRIKEKALVIENYITERLMIKADDVYKVRGGKYTKDDVDYKMCGEGCRVLKDRPLCDCGYPCEVRCFVNNKKHSLYFLCSLKNVWCKMNDDIRNIEIGKPCSYYREYLDDIEFRVQFKKERKNKM